MYEIPPGVRMNRHIQRYIQEIKTKEDIKTMESRRRKGRFIGYCICTASVITTFVLAYFGWPASGYTLGIITTLLVLIIGCMKVDDNR